MELNKTFCLIFVRLGLCFMWRFLIIFVACESFYHVWLFYEVVGKVEIFRALDLMMHLIRVIHIMKESLVQVNLVRRTKPNSWFFYNSAIFGCRTTNLGLWVVGVIRNHAWKFQEFLNYGIGCSKTFTEFEKLKKNVIETIEDPNNSSIAQPILLKASSLNSAVA